MRTPQLELACGCVVAFRDGENPLCPAHGIQRVVRALGMPVPRFRGAVTGPHAETVDLGAFVGPLPGLEKATNGQ